MEFLWTIVLVLFTTKVAGHLSVRLGQPSVLGKIIVGILLGPAVFGLLQETDEAIKLFSEIGVLLLMFLAGLETDLKQLNATKVSATSVAIGGIIFPIVLSYAGAMYFDLSTGEAIFIGLLLAATSVSISVQTLRELGKLSTKEGSTLLGAAVLDDVLVVILLAIAMSFFGNAEGAISILILKKVLFFVVLVIIAKYGIPQFIKFFSKLKVTETTLVAGLIVCFGLAYFAESLGIAGIIGAFAAGLIISTTKFKEAIEHRTEPIAYGIFVPFFFVSIGLSVKFDGFMEQIVFIIIFTVIALLSKFIGAGLGARLTGFNMRSAMGIGAGMISRGEVALIIAAMGLESGLMQQQFYTPLVIVVIITTLATPPLLKLFFADKKTA